MGCESKMEITARELRITMWSLPGRSLSLPLRLSEPVL